MPRIRMSVLSHAVMLRLCVAFFSFFFVGVNVDKVGVVDCR
jgi:hypothetical protein